MCPEGPTSRNAEEACPECGQPGCEAQRDELLARDYEQPALYWSFHRMAVDAYCMQHSRYVASAKSFAAHLCGLCIAFEHANDAAQFRQLQRWLSTNPKIERPNLPAHRGDITIGKLYGIRDPIRFGETVKSWARAVWEAYQHLQPLARGWLSVTAGKRR